MRTHPACVRSYRGDANNHSADRTRPIVLRRLAGIARRLEDQPARHLDGYSGGRLAAEA